MAKNTDTNKDSALNPLDLSQLSDLSFGPDWASGSGKKRTDSSYKNHDGQDRRPSRPGRRQGGGQRDRRGDNTSRTGNSNDRRGYGGRGDRGSEGRTFTPPFEPTVDVIFVSQDKPFEVLLKAMRTTFKTYELFEIARIVLGKENRFVAIVSPKADADDKKLFISAPDQVPFQTREEAINHVMNNHLERFFEITEVEVEPPSGNFQMVNRCKLTGELLAPPNFHRYQDILKEHFSKNITNLSFERFVERVESVKDPEVVQEWLDKMKVTRRYTLIQKEGDESPKVVLSALEDVKYYLTTERKNEVFLAKDKIRLPGEKIETLPKGTLRRSVERELEIQRRFPLITSNHLRGRLRRCNLNFFKKGSKGITYVCAVKRKPRYKDTVFSESIQALIDYIESKPKILAEDLLNTYLPSGATEVNEATQQSTNQDLRWLIGAGYVSEFGNGELFAEKALPILAAEDKNNPVTANEPRRGGKGKGKKSPKTKAPVATPESETPAEEATTTVAEVTETPAVEEVKAETEVVTETPAAEVGEPAKEAAPEVEEVKAEAEVVTETPAAEVAVPVKEAAPESEEAKAEAEVVADTPAAEVAEPAKEAAPESEEVKAEDSEEKPKE